VEKFIIEGQKPLRGEITASGNKNAALPLLAATLLTEETVILHNIPIIQDVLTMRLLLESMGVTFENISETSWKIDSKNLHFDDLDQNHLKKIRASILLAGPLTARGDDVYLPPPGGDVIGRRRLDTHLLALRSLGAQVNFNQEKKVFHFSTTERLIGTNILLDEASVTATENTIMASVLAKGTTIIKNAASEPHIQDLCNFLNVLGAKISNIGSNTLTIIGVGSLAGGEFSIGADYIEVVSYIGAAVVTGGEIIIRKANPQYLDMVKLVFNRMGIDWENQGDDIFVPANQSLEIKSDIGNAIPEIKVNIWPAFPSDVMSIAIMVATQCKGSILFHDWMYPSRMYFTDKLVGMGAQIVLCDPHRVIINGPTPLIGENLESPDIRAGMALVLAALAGKGKSVIRNIAQIDRGYSQLETKLKSLGADITRVTE
jgi:UDP-N-acetylglucosamine 1-carboxyvinyltransferase